MKKTLMVVVTALVLLFATDVRCEFKKCVGPGGDVRIVNTECPEGYSVEATRSESEPSSPDNEEPYMCRFADIIEAGEIDSSLAEAEEALIKVRAKADREAEGYWMKCLEDLKQRKVKLQTPIEEPDTGPAACTEGEFEYKEKGIYFTNSRRGSCRGVRAVCTFDVRKSQRIVRDGGNRRGDRRDDEYTTVTTQKVQNFSFDGKVGKFGTERIGDTDIKGRLTGVSCQIIE
jgi:hypothetical protein